MIKAPERLEGYKARRLDGLKAGKPERDR